MQLSFSVGLVVVALMSASLADAGFGKKRGKGCNDGCDTGCWLGQRLRRPRLFPSLGGCGDCGATMASAPVQAAPAPAPQMVEQTDLRTAMDDGQSEGQGHRMRPTQKSGPCRFPACPEHAARFLTSTR